MSDSKKILFVIASENFREDEYEKPKSVLESSGVEITTASSQPGERPGTLGEMVTVDVVLDEVNAADFDGIVFVGGAGAMEYFDSSTALELVREIYKAGKVVAAICVAPSILANAGILQGKKATSHPSEENNLKQKGANYTGEWVTVDEKIVTSRGPQAAKEFGRKIVEVLMH